MTEKELTKLKNRILEACQPMMEELIQELKSTTFYDAALQADKYNNRALAQRFRNAGDSALERERLEQFEESLNVYKEFEIEGKEFILANYIPRSIDVLICIMNVSKALVVRIANDELEEIDDLEIKQDIASLFQRKPVAKANIPSLSSLLVYGQKYMDGASDAAKKKNAAILADDRKRAKELAETINQELGTNISWRWFFGDKFTKKAVGSSESKVSVVATHTIDGYHVAILKRMTDVAMWSQFYVIIGNVEKSLVMNIYKTKKGTFVFGYEQPGPIYRVTMKAKPEWAGEFAMPVAKACVMQNIYDFLAANKRVTRMLFDFVARNIDVYLSLSDIATAVKRDAKGGKGAKWSSFNNSFDGDDEEMPASVAATDDDMDDFADL